MVPDGVLRGGDVCRRVMVMAKATSGRRCSKVRKGIEEVVVMLLGFDGSSATEITSLCGYEDRSHAYYRLQAAVDAGLAMSRWGRDCADQKSVGYRHNERRFWLTPAGEALADTVLERDGLLE